MAKKVRFTVTWTQTKTFDAIVPDETDAEDFRNIVWAYGHQLRDMDWGDEFPESLGNDDGSHVILGVPESGEEWTVKEETNG
jgi:hypothetical protein